MGSVIRKAMSKPGKNHEKKTEPDPIRSLHIQVRVKRAHPAAAGQAAFPILHAAWIILSSRCGAGIQHSGLHDIKSGAAHQKGDDNPGNDL